MPVSRRQILKGAIGGAGLLACGSLGRYLLNAHLSKNYATGQLGGFPLLLSNKNEKFEVSLSLSAVGGYFNAGTISKSLKNFFFVLFYDPDGNLKFKEEFVLDSFRQKLVHFENLGWGSVIVASALPENPEQLPQIDAMASFSHKTFFGEDGHHLQAIREKNQRSCHTIFSPAVDEERLISFFNPHPDEVSGKIEVFNRNGDLIFSSSYVWGPFATKYIAVGNSKVIPPNTKRLEGLSGEPLFFSAVGPDTGRLLSSSWHFKSSDQSFFAQSHGANFSLPANAGYLAEEDALINNLSKAQYLSEVSQAKEVFPGDYGSFAEGDLKTKIFIPNATSQTIRTGVFVSNPEGKLIGNTFASQGPIVIQPRGIAEIDIDKLIPAKEKNKFNAISCYVGANVYSSYSLAKSVTVDPAGRKMYQHLRPHDGQTTPELFKHYFQSTHDFFTDYWIGNIDFHSNSEVVGLIRNNSPFDEHMGTLYYYDENSLLLSLPLPPIRGNGFILQSLPSPSSPTNVGMRLVAPKGNLTISICSKNGVDSHSIRHASGKLNRYPNIFRLKNWV